MVKKYVLAAAILARLLNARETYAPTQSDFNVKFYPKSELEVTVTDELGETFVKQQENFKRTVDGIVEEKKEEQRDEIFGKSDKVYKTVYKTYNSLRDFLGESEIPKYITKEFIRKIVRIESTDYPRAVGKLGERGYTQMTKEAWYEVETENFEENAFIPEKNIRASIKYFLKINRFCRGNHPHWNNLSDKDKIKMLVAAYNGGMGNLKKRNWDLSRMKPITKNYIKKIEGAMDYILSK